MMSVALNSDIELIRSKLHFFQLRDEENTRKNITKAREEFAVRLRKSKKKHILEQKRIKKKQMLTIMSVNESFDNLHPGLSFSFVPIEDKIKLIVQLLEEEIVLGRFSDRMLQLCMLVRKLISGSTNNYVPCLEFLEADILSSLLPILNFAHIDELILGEATLIIANIFGVVSEHQILSSCKHDFLAPIFSIACATQSQEVFENCALVVYNICSESKELYYMVYNHGQFKAFLRELFECALRTESVLALCINFMDCYLEKQLMHVDINANQMAIVTQFMTDYDKLAVSTILQLLNRKTNDPNFVIHTWKKLDLKDYLQKKLKSSTHSIQVETLLVIGCVPLCSVYFQDQNQKQCLLIEVYRAIRNSLDFSPSQEVLWCLSNLLAEEQATRDSRMSSLFLQVEALFVKLLEILSCRQSTTVVTETIYSLKNLIINATFSECQWMIQNRLLETLMEALSMPFQAEDNKFEIISTIGILLFEKQPNDYSVLDLFVEMKGHQVLRQLACNGKNAMVMNKSEAICKRIEYALTISVQM